MTSRTVILVSSALVIAAIGGTLLFWPRQLPSPATPRDEPAPTSYFPTPNQPVPAAPLSAPSHKSLQAQAIPGAAQAFTFTAEIPAEWQAEAAATEAISLYDPAAPGENNLEKSQIFIRHFTGNDFLTLSTVTIHARERLTVANRPAIRYDIEKQPGIPNFSSQPAWRSQRHVVTDIRVSDANPSVFYVIAKQPDLEAAIYDRFLASLQVSELGTSLIEPVAEFQTRITKKPFGISITPENSPVSPERFTGYHTGVDVEYDDVLGPVPVRAIAAGTVRVSRRASGYGGVVAIEHTLGPSKFSAVYGHLQPTSLPTVGQTVAAGERIGLLGAHRSSETDFERKHLHFAILKEPTIDLRGYVPTSAQLSAWHNPPDFLEFPV